MILSRLHHLFVQLLVPDGVRQRRVVRGQHADVRLLGPGGNLLEEVHLRGVVRWRWFDFWCGLPAVARHGTCRVAKGNFPGTWVYFFPLPPSPPAVYQRACFSGRWYTPLKRSPDPIGQLTAYVCSLNSFSIWSHSSSGEREGRSILLQKVKIGRPLMRQTSKSLRVCGSRPGAREPGRRSGERRTTLYATTALSALWRREATKPSWEKTFRSDQYTLSRSRQSAPFPASMSITALSEAESVRYVSSEKSAWPGVSRRFSVNPL